MYLVVVDSFNCSSQRATDAEKLSTTKTWSRILFDIIPEMRLQDVFDYTFAHHSSPFPINAYDLKLGWEQLHAAEEAERVRLVEEDRALNRVAYCEDRHNHRSENEATQEYQVGGGYVWLPCAICRTGAYWQRVKEIKATITDHSIDEKRVEDVIKRMSEAVGLRLVKDAQ